MVPAVVPLVPILNVDPNELIVDEFKVAMVSVPWAAGYVKKNILCFFKCQIV